MAVLPFRGLAEKGILRDPNPYQLDLNAWSAGSGVRFHANKAERAPIFRSVVESLGTSTQFCIGYRSPTTYDFVIVGMQDGRVFSYTKGNTKDVSVPGRVLSGDPRAWTGSYLGQVSYLNRPDRAPIYYGPNSATYNVLPNMDCAWTCRALRAFGDYVIAFNVTKPASYVQPHSGLTLTGGTFANLVKWSDLTLNGQVPGSWDFTDPTTNSGENPLEELTTPIVDAVAMRSALVIYSQDQIWAMEQTSSNAVFTFRKLFGEGGLLAPNCAVEIEGKHYVFGPTDIYVHDSIQKTSLVDKRNRDYIYRNLSQSQSEQCFVIYMPKYREILFAYPSGDSDAAFPVGSGANKGGIYNLVADTWSFIDLPNISAASLASLSSGLTYATAGAVTYATIGGSYYDQDDGYDQHVVMVSGALPGVLTQSRILAYDFMNKGSLSFPYSPECNAPAFLERTGIDLDQLGSDLTTYKNVRRIYPQVTIYDNVPIQIQIGGCETPSGPINWSAPVSFNPMTQYKVDMMKGGRYLAIRIITPVPVDWEVAGFDADVTTKGRR